MKTTYFYIALAVLLVVACALPFEDDEDEIRDEIEADPGYYGKHYRGYGYRKFYRYGKRYGYGRKYGRYGYRYKSPYGYRKKYGYY